MSSQRNRGKARNGGDQGEEVLLWGQIQDNIREIIRLTNINSDHTREVIAKDEHIARNRKDMTVTTLQGAFDALDAAMRVGVKSSDNLTSLITQTMDLTKTLAGVQRAKEEEQAIAMNAASGSRSGGLGHGSRNASRAVAAARDREHRDSRERKEDKESARDKDRDHASLYDFDGAGDSPVPSPAGRDARKMGASSERSGGARDSAPPRGDRDTPSRQGDSVEPQPPSSKATESLAAATQRSKVAFAKGQDVAFKPKPNSSADVSDWYLGKVQQVSGEGKSRRYKVKDEDPDVPPEDRQEYRTSASSMIPIPPPGTSLPELDKSKTVLALYPDSTTFYKAEVMDTDPETGKVSLRFEGEENTGTLQTVERRFVVEYRS